jgi:dipeptidase E
MEDRSVRAPRIVAIGEEDREGVQLRHLISMVKPAGPRLRVCFLPTALEDNEEYIRQVVARFSALQCSVTVLRLCTGPIDGAREILLAQDLIYMGEGRTGRLVEVLVQQELAPVLREAWQAGVVLAGVSAGTCAMFAQAVCWRPRWRRRQGAPLRARGGRLLGRVLSLYRRFGWRFYVQPGIGLLTGSCCVHYDNSARRAAYHRFLQRGQIGPGLAVPDGAALIFAGASTPRREAVSAVEGTQVTYVQAADGRISERREPTRYIGEVR